MGNGLELKETRSRMERRKIINSLTSLRFFAAAAVVLFHGKSTFGMPAILSSLSLTEAVSFFFVLSGFILAHSHRTIETRSEVARFYLSRFARIWPAHLVTALIAIAIISHQNGPLSFLSGAANLLLLQSWVPESAFFFSLNGVSWSLSDEMFFYALFPLIVLQTKSGAMKWLAVSAVVTALMIAAFNFSSDPMIRLWGASISPLTRVTEFILGICASQLFQRRPERYLSKTTASLLEVVALLSIVAVLRIGHYPSLTQWGVPDGLALWLANTGGGLGFAFAIFVFAMEKGVFSRILRYQPLIYLGEVSFAIYLTHQLVFRVGVWSGGLSRILAYWALTLFTAIVLHHLVERPCQRIIIRAATTSRPLRRLFRSGTAS